MLYEVSLSQEMQCHEVNSTRGATKLSLKTKQNRILDTIPGSADPHVSCNKTKTFEDLRLQDPTAGSADPHV